MKHLFSPDRRTAGGATPTTASGMPACRFLLDGMVDVLLGASLNVLPGAPVVAADRDQSDSDARYLHHISLYDIDNRKITPESTRPYSPLNTCGRCHDYETISHGWHFNAFEPKTVDGRPGEPWIWTDEKTGTTLPLTYRDWPGMYSPEAIGISPWEMTLQFGARIPGGNMGAEEDAVNEPAEDASVASPSDESGVARWQFSGSLEIDCMVCHAVSGAYDFGERRRQINEENFAWAPTAALRLGKVDGRVSQIKDGSDPDDEATKKRIPVVTYDESVFGLDGSVFMDLIRKPSSNACFQCHSNRTVGDQGIEARWIHDDDVHLQSGMVCADCHRNGIDHHIVRGFDGEEHPSGVEVETLSCAGCHLGAHDLGAHDGDQEPQSLASRAGRLGAPKPLHAGLPPLHFEKLTCTACHGGPIPDAEAKRLMTSLAHGLGEKGHRTGAELPAIVAPVFAKGEDGRVAPHRAMWPAYWGYVQENQVVPLPPSQVYDLTRRSLRVRSSFIEEILKPRVSSSDLKELLGEDRARQQEEWTDEEQAKVDAAQASAGRKNFSEKVHGALQALETELGVETAVYVSAGLVYGRGEQEAELRQLEIEAPQAKSMIRWPMAHNVRPAGWSLGVGGCTDCHSDEGKIFTSTVAAIGPGPDGGAAVSMATLQGIDPDQQLSWNEMFQSRSAFKYMVAGSVAVLLMTIFVGLGALASRWLGRVEA